MEKGIEKAEVYKFSLPDGRTAEMSAEGSGEERMSALQGIVNMYYPAVSVMEPKDELLTLAKRSLYRMAMLCDQLNRESGSVPEPAKDDIEARKRKQEIADAAALACYVIMKHAGHRFILAHHPKECPEGIAVQTHPDTSDPDWKAFCESLGRRLLLMDYEQGSRA